jgi:DNA-binding MarR family transcriptional regulator
MPKDKTGDTIDRFKQEWATQRPDLDFDYLATIGRILRVSAHLRENMDRWLAPFGLTWEMFDLVASLQRSGGGTGLRPTDLYEECMLSSGATTNRVDRAEKLDYAVRRPDPDDGRATRIALTRRGRTLAAKAMTEHAKRAGQIAQRLNAKERKQLAGLLRKLLLSLETEAAPAAGKEALKQPPKQSSKQAANGREIGLA